VEPGEQHEHKKDVPPTNQPQQWPQPEEIERERKETKRQSNAQRGYQRLARDARHELPEQLKTKVYSLEDRWKLKFCPQNEIHETLR
jgi:hypothetical protein